MYQENYIANWQEVVEHILNKWPEEAGGFVTTDNVFHPIENLAEDKIHCYDMDPAELIGREVKCFLHSHTYNPDKPPAMDPRVPSKADLQVQIDLDVECAIVVCEGENVTQPIFWGDYSHRPDLMDREFIHSIQDCLCFMQDWHYSEYGLKLPMFARNPDWFETGENHMEEQYKGWGFVDVTNEPRQKGDVVFYRMASKVVNHIGVMVDANTVVHQLYNRFPKSEPFEKHRKYIVRRIRHSSLNTTDEKTA